MNVKTQHEHAPASKHARVDDGRSDAFPIDGKVFTHED